MCAAVSRPGFCCVRYRRQLSAQQDFSVRVGEHCCCVALQLSMSDLFTHDLYVQALVMIAPICAGLLPFLLPLPRNDFWPCLAVTVLFDAKFGFVWHSEGQTVQQPRAKVWPRCRAVDCGWRCCETRHSAREALRRR
jgi:hypothetical protein